MDGGGSRVTRSLFCRGAPENVGTARANSTFVANQATDKGSEYEQASRSKLVHHLTYIPTASRYAWVLGHPSRPGARAATSTRHAACDVARCRSPPPMAPPSSPRPGLTWTT
eukprot:6202709-Pleurochrysis_carterae.AAC.1